MSVNNNSTFQYIEKSTPKARNARITMMDVLELPFSPIRLEKIFSFSDHQSVHRIMTHYINLMQIIEITNHEGLKSKRVSLGNNWLSDFELTYLLHQSCRYVKNAFIEKAQWAPFNRYRDTIYLNEIDIHYLYSKSINLQTLRNFQKNHDMSKL